MKNYKIVKKNIDNKLVHKVLKEKEDKYYIMKQIPINNIKKENLKTIENDIQNLSKLDNINVVKYYSCFKDNNYLNIIMEYCVFSNLRKFIDYHKNNNKPISQNVLNIIISDIISGLGYVHNKNIIHRNLKPENIFIDKNYNIKIGDFGIINQFNNMSKSDYINGDIKLNYMAPELFNGEKYNNKSDMWALGCMIYELCSLNYCFDGLSRKQLVNKIKNNSYQKIGKNLYDSNIIDLIYKLLNRNYNERPEINQINLTLNNNDNLNNDQNLYFLDYGILNRSNMNRNDLKIIVLGSSCTNKTKFVNKWTKNSFSEEYKATIVSEYGFKIFENNGDLYRVQLWDIAGQDRNYNLTKIFAKNAHGVVIMSSAINIGLREEAIKLKNLVEELDHFCDGEKLPCILVENDIDLLGYPKEGELDFNELWKNNGFIGGFRVSSKTGENVNESMEFLIKNIIKRRDDYDEKRFNENLEITNKEFRNNILQHDDQKKIRNKYCLVF